jgi:diaminopimelate decarboxylase
MKDLKLPFNQAQATDLLSQYGSPLYVYDERGIRSKVQKSYSSMKPLKGYKNFFAVKATPTPSILRILHDEGMGFDCSSRIELEMMKRMGIPGEDIFYTSNNTIATDFELALELGATINIDDLSQVETFVSLQGLSQNTRVALRYNPGDLKEGNVIIGKPTDAKYGMNLDQLVSGFELLKSEGIQTFGLHTMVASNELNESYFAETARILLAAVDFVEVGANAKISFVNLGGGFGVNYRPDQDEIDLLKIGTELQVEFASRPDIEVYTENGRYVMAPHGYLVSKVINIMHKYKDYVGLDASMHNLMRPGMYGAYHHITVLGKSDDTRAYDVVGSLCENNDKFAINRKLPEVEVGDIVAIHDTGAHGHAMGFNYNGLLRSAEVLLKTDGTSELIRRAETAEDYFAPVVW